MKRKTKRPARGKGKFGDLLRKGRDFLKQTKLISKTARAVAPTFPMAYPVAQLARSYGYGKAKKRKIGMKGKGLWDWIKNKALPFLRKTKIISSVGNALSSVIPLAGTVGKIAGTAGYGKRRVVARNVRLARTVKAKSMKRRKTHMRGRGIGHTYTPQSGVGIAGTATYSSGRVQF